MKDLELPHNAWIDKESGLVTIIIDRMTVTFELEEFMTFANNISDVQHAVDQLTTITHETCESCGTELSYANIEPIDDDDYN